MTPLLRGRIVGVILAHPGSEDLARQASVATGLDFFWNHEGGAVFPGEELVGLVVLNKTFGFGVHVQHGTEGGGRFGQVHFIGGEVLFHAGKHFGHVLVVFDGLTSFLG